MKRSDALASAQKKLGWDELYAAFANAPHGVELCDGQGKIQFVNPAWEALTGYSLDEVRGQKPAQLLRSGVHEAGFHEGIRDVVQGGATWHGDIVCKHKSGRLVPMEVTITPVISEAGARDRIVVHRVDLTDRYRIRELLQRQAFTDPLTGVANRAYFMSALDDAMQNTAPDRPGQLAVLFIDLDRFKVINDTLGHEAGDRVLTVVARRLQEQTRPGDVVARLGGDEFAVMLNRLASADQAERISRRIMHALTRPVSTNGRTLNVGASVGLCFRDVVHLTREDLMRDADAAMYRAKNSGGGKLVLFDDHMRDRDRHQARLMDDLWVALERRQLHLLYQPVVDLGDGRLKGFEAFLRWVHPDEGLLRPSDFLAAAARDPALSRALGRWVLRSACKAARRWSAAGVPSHLTLFVNLSATELADPGLIEGLAGVLEAEQVAPARLTLEVSESDIVADREGAFAALRDLRSLGVGVAIDDFGESDASLTLLERVRPTALRLHPSLISGLARTRRRDAMVTAVLSAAAAFDIQVVAEGVETQGQADRLLSLGCVLAQGYRLAEPMSDVDAAVAAHSGSITLH